MKNLIISLINYLFPVPDQNVLEATYAHFSVKNPLLANVDEYKFVFTQAEKRLDDSNKTFDATTTKSVTLISLGVVILSTLTTYFFLQNDIEGTFNPKLFTVLMLAVYSFIVLYFLIRNILPSDYQPVGSLPSDLLLQEFYDEYTNQENAPDHEKTIRAMYFSELVSYDHRIEWNNNVNAVRLFRFRRCTIALLMLPIIGLAVYCGTTLIHWFYLHHYLRA